MGPDRLKRAIRDGVLGLEGRRLVLDRTWARDGEGSASSWRRQLHVTLSSCPPRQRATAVVFRRAAAALWGMDGFGPGPVEIAVTAGRLNTPGLHGVRLLSPGERQVVDGFPVTSVGRTLLDLGQVVTDVELMERAVEWSLRSTQVTVSDLAELVGRHPKLPGTRVVRSVLERRPAGTTPTESDAETLFLQLARGAGLPDPSRQFSVQTVGGTFRVDFAWPRRRLAVEIDGAATHASREALRRDLHRQNLVLLSLANSGWALLRFTWDDVVNARFRREVISQLREAWAIGGRPTA